MKPLILYDGHCALCSGAVQTILRLDDKGVFTFAPLQSIASGQLAQQDASLASEVQEALDTDSIDLDSIDSVILVAGQKAYIKSSAFLQIIKKLGWPYRVLGIASVLPQGLRNKIYDWVARNRYRIFGTHQSCWIPSKEWKGRFLGE